MAIAICSVWFMEVINAGFSSHSGHGTQLVSEEVFESHRILPEMQKSLTNSSQRGLTLIKVISCPNLFKNGCSERKTITCLYHKWSKLTRDNCVKVLSLWLQFVQFVMLNLCTKEEACVEPGKSIYSQLSISGECRYKDTFVSSY